MNDELSLIQLGVSLLGYCFHHCKAGKHRVRKVLAEEQVETTQY